MTSDHPGRPFCYKLVPGTEECKRPCSGCKRSLLLAMHAENDLYVVAYSHCNHVFHRRCAVSGNVKPDKSSHRTALTIAGCAVGIIAAPILAPLVLGAFGFGAGGVVGGSIAAGIQATMGGQIAAGSAFAVAQSVGAGGALPVIGYLGGALAGGAAAQAAGKCEAKGKGKLAEDEKAKLAEEDEEAKKVAAILSELPEACPVCRSGKF